MFLIRHSRLFDTLLSYLIRHTENIHKESLQLTCDRRLLAELPKRSEIIVKFHFLYYANLSQLINFVILRNHQKIIGFFYYFRGNRKFINSFKFA